jgi:RNA polymerase sigma factor (sigma-70 family)
MNYTYISPADLDAFLASLQPTVARIARRYYYATLHLSIDLADLEQEGMIGAWKALLKVDSSRLPGEIYTYCLRAADMAIEFFLRRENRKPAGSLDAYLQPNGREGRPREIAATTANQTVSSLATRRATLRLLRHYLNQQQQAVLMADFQIDQPRRGHAETSEQVMSRLGLSQSAWDACKYRALRRLKRELAEKQVQA